MIIRQNVKSRHFILALIYGSLIVAFAFITREYINQLENILEVLLQATWYGIGIAVALIIAALIVQAHLYRLLYILFEIPTKLQRVWSLYLITRFVNVAIPSGGLAGMAPFIHDAYKRNLPPGKIVIINLTYVILWYSAFALFLTIGLTELFIFGHLRWFEIIAGITLLVITLLLVAGLIAAGLFPNRLAGIIARAIDWYGRVLKRPIQYIKQRTNLFIEELHIAFETLRNAQAVEWFHLIGFALLNEFLHLSVLFTLSRTFNQPFQYGTLVAAYSISILFFILSPTPGGLGFVEGILLIVLTSLGHSQEGALILMLSYRGITFWLPFILGFGVTLTNRGLGLLDHTDEK